MSADAARTSARATSVRPADGVGVVAGAGRSEADPRGHGEGKRCACRGLWNRPRILSGVKLRAAWLITFSTEAAAAAAARPLGFGAGFIDAQGSAIEVRTV